MNIDLSLPDQMLIRIALRIYIDDYANNHEPFQVDKVQELLVRIQDMEKNSSLLI